MMRLDHKMKFVLVMLGVSVTTGLGISEVNAIFPFDQFMTTRINETTNQSSQDPFSNLSGEHGESPDEKDMDSPFD